MANKKTEGKMVEITKKQNKKLKTDEIFMIIIIVLLIGYLILALYPSFQEKGSKKTKIEIIKINAEECKECFDLNLISSILEKNEKIEIKDTKDINYNSNEAQELIEKYKIEKIPALIVLSKNINELGLDKNMFRQDEKEERVSIFDKPVPYLNLETEKVEGIAGLIEVYDGSCKECRSLLDIRAQLEKAGVKVGSYEKIEASSEQGKNLISENALVFLPSLLLDKEIEEYWWFFPDIRNVLFEKENYFVLRNLIAPYKDIKTGEIKGKVAMTYVTNKSCEDCYNVTNLKELFARIGVYIDKEKYVDISSREGKNLLNNYNITAIPTIILSREISDYNIKEMLEKIGKFKDDEFVFTSLDTLNVKYQEIK